MSDGCAGDLALSLPLARQMRETYDGACHSLHAFHTQIIAQPGFPNCVKGVWKCFVVMASGRSC
eukprot:5842694-Amphidinium_carterae.1